MDYDDVVAAAFVPTPDGTRARPAAGASLARRFRDAIEPIAMHAVWSRLTNERLAALGLDFRTGYVWGRAAALGEPEPGLVVSSFAVFEPTMITSAYEEGRRSCGRIELLTARTDSTIESLAMTLADADVSTVADALQGAVAAADVTGRPLFGGLTSQPWPDEPIGRLWHACELAREHRGDSHVAVCVERGLGPVEMNILTELWVGMPLGSYTSTRGWSQDQIGRSVARLQASGLVDQELLSPHGQRLRDEIEAATDRLEQPVVEALGSDSAAFIDQLDAWSQRCIDGKAFPPNVFKRAAG